VTTSTLVFWLNDPIVMEAKPMLLEGVFVGQSAAYIAARAIAHGALILPFASQVAR
jgi:hypothetical protein